MKNVLFIFISILLLASCSTSKTYNRSIFQKRKYTKGIYFNNKNHQPVTRLITTPKNELRKTKNTAVLSLDRASFDLVSITDSVKITLKNGAIYNGVIKEETDEGILLQLKNTRTIYLLKSDIVEITTLTNVNEQDHPKTRRNGANEQGKELTIVLKNGEKLQGVVASSNKKEYKVLTSSGERVYIKKQKVKNIYNANKKAKLHPVSKLSFILFILGVFSAPFGIGILLLLIGAPLGIIGFKATRKLPEKYNYLKAKRLKNVYIVFFAVILSLTLLLFLSFGL